MGGLAKATVIDAVKTAMNDFMGNEFELVLSKIGSELFSKCMEAQSLQNEKLQRMESELLSAQKEITELRLLVKKPCSTCVGAKVRAGSQSTQPARSVRPARQAGSEASEPKQPDQAKVDSNGSGAEASSTDGNLKPTYSAAAKDREPTQQDPWRKVVFKRRPKVGVVGTGQQDTISAAVPNVKIFVSKIAAGTNPEQIRSYLSEKLNVEASVSERVSKYPLLYSSFIVTASGTALSQLMSSESWPKGTFVKRWYPAKPAIPASQTQTSSGEKSVSPKPHQRSEETASPLATPSRKEDGPGETTDISTNIDDE